MCVSGPKQRQRFLCELRVPSYNYVGVGNSINKKDAQANAAKDFVQFLIRKGEVNPAEVPDFQVGDGVLFIIYLFVILFIFTWKGGQNRMSTEIFFFIIIYFFILLSCFLHHKKKIIIMMYTGQQ